MKIAWFSPLPPLKSGISEYSELILGHLKKYAQIDLWVDGFSPRPDFSREFRVIDYINRRRALPLLKTYDAVIYNMGNNAEFHSGMYEVLQEYPGIVILHDYVLHHFFAGYWLDKKNNPAGYFEEMRRQYGDQGEGLARKSLRVSKKPLWETDDVILYPLSKSVLQKATGIVVHSEFVKKLIEKSVPAQIRKLNQPVFPLFPSSLMKTRRELNLPEDKVILASFGFVTPVKRLDKVFSVIAKNGYLRSNAFVLIIGESAPGYRLEDFAARYDLTHQVRFLGYLPIEEAYAYLNLADVCLNLRYPTMGETSGSLIRIMSLGKPTVVSNVGWYAELPDDCVVKIDPANEEAELMAWLRRLVSDAELREKIGKSAQTYVQREHSLEKFVQKLYSFVQEISAGENNLYIRILDKITDTLADLSPAAGLVLSGLSAQLTWLYPGGREKY